MHPFICARSGGNMDDNGPNESNVKVAVRVRPTNRRGRCTNHVIVFFFFFFFPPVVSCSVTQDKLALLLPKRATRKSLQNPRALAVSFSQHHYENIHFAPSLGMFWQSYRGKGNWEGKIGKDTVTSHPERTGATMLAQCHVWFIWACFVNGTILCLAQCSDSSAEIPSSETVFCPCMHIHGPTQAHKLLLVSVFVRTLSFLTFVFLFFLFWKKCEHS